VKYYDWDKLKNVALKAERNVCFEDIVATINEGNVLDVIQHQNPDKYPGQKIYVVKIDNYIYLVPFIEDENKYFLKTIYASRKMTKQYLFGRRTQ
jgi:hypothetical protein